MRTPPSFICAKCGKEHSELPDLESDAPVQWVDEFHDDSESLLTSDLCIIKGIDFFVRGVIEIPIHDYKSSFGFGVWVTHKKENFEIYRNNFHACDGIGPFFGWLSTEIKYYRTSTIELKTLAHYRGNGKRPWIELEPGEQHPLARHQREGINLAEAWDIVHFYDK